MFNIKGNEILFIFIILFIKTVVMLANFISVAYAIVTEELISVHSYSTNWGISFAGIEVTENIVSYSLSDF